MNEPVTPTTPGDLMSLGSILHEFRSIGDTDAYIAELKKREEWLAHQWRCALERCEAQVSERDETILKLTAQHHKLKNDYRCTLATLKAAVEVAQYELEYVTLNQAKPSV